MCTLTTPDRPKDVKNSVLSPTLAATMKPTTHPQGVAEPHLDWQVVVNMAQGRHCAHVRLYRRATRPGESGNNRKWENRAKDGDM